MLVSGAPGLEELNKLLTGTVIVPFAVAAHDLDQMVERLLPTVIAVQRYCKIKARLMIERVCDDFLFQLGDRPKMDRPFGDFKRRAGGGHRGFASLGFLPLCQGLFSMLDAAGF